MMDDMNLCGTNILEDVMEVFLIAVQQWAALPTHSRSACGTIIAEACGNIETISTRNGGALVMMRGRAMVGGLHGYVYECQSFGYKFRWEAEGTLV